MPLPAPAIDRSLLHTRTIVCEGFARSDGLYDIDGWITDVRSYSFPNHDRGTIAAGEPLHAMGIRLTVEETFMIRDVVAVTDFAPLHICAAVTPNFRRLIGMRLAPGFTVAARKAIRGTDGCTHLLDLLGPIATTAFQTISGRHFGRRDPDAPPPDARLVNSCHGWRDDGAMVQREFPDLYKGPRRGS
jgi:hypothetical protein